MTKSEKYLEEIDCENTNYLLYGKPITLAQILQDYADRALIIDSVSQQRELLAFIEEVSEFDALVSSTRLRLRAKELLKANCG